MLRPVRAVTEYIRDNWPDRAALANVYTGAAVVGGALGAAVGWLRGEVETGVVLGVVSGALLGIAWVLLAAATRGRDRSWRDPDPDVFVKPASTDD